MSARTAILVANFAQGALAVCAQSVLLRETQVILFGSELSWGLVLAYWLAGVGAGAAVAGRVEKPAGLRAPLAIFAVSTLATVAALVGAIVALRLARALAGAGPGEYVQPVHMLWIAALAAGVSVWVGAAFTAASSLLAQAETHRAGQARAIGWIYLVDSAGSLIGGALFSFVLVERAGAIALASGGGAVLAATIALLIHKQTGRRWPVAACLLAAAALAAFVGLNGAARVDARTTLARWRTFATGLELLDSADTRYQNLALGRLGNQFSLYSSGLVSATWPNDADLAIHAHLAACMHPRPRRILLLGGGAEGTLKELLRHGPERLDFVTLDPAGISMMRDRLPAADRDALDAVRPTTRFDDVRRFVKCSPAGRYDLVILAAPEPASTLHARFYTEEFFEEVARALADDGVLAFSLSGSVGYWSPEASQYVGSVLRPLERVFADVLITFGYPTCFFAAKRAGVVTDSGEELSRRYRLRDVRSPHFDALWFEGASDLLDREKRARTRQAILFHPPPVDNTDSRPAAALYHMRFWLQSSASVHQPPQSSVGQRVDVLGLASRLRFEHVVVAAAVAAAMVAAAGIVRGGAALGRTAMAWSVGTTGFASLALEVVLLYTFQTLYGYVYSMVGMVVGVFMAGLVGGSLLMNRRIGRAAAAGTPLPGLRTAAALDLSTAVFAGAMVLALAVLRQTAAGWAAGAATFLLVALAGVLGGLVFPLGAAVSLESSPGAGRTAGRVAAADYAGACLGALVTGTVVVPVFGVTGACLAVVAVKSLSALLTGAASMLPARPAAQARA